MFKKIYDPIHGYIDINDNIIKIIDNPYFKRLKYIKQLGTCYEVFPGASHNRFEHSIGVYHLTNKMITNLNNNHEYKIYNKNFIDDKTKLLINIAGLCHDLGHGPFSHVFDNEILKNSKSEYKYHEKRSCMIVENILQNISFNHIKLNGYDIDFIKNLINPTTQNNYLYQIVSNNINGIDTDKFDYIERDIYNIGLKYSYDYNRIINDCKIIDNNICYYDKIKYQIFDLFYTRYRLHKEIYNHPVVKSIEYMIKDILYDLDKHISFTNDIDNINFTNYRDDILFKIYDIKDKSLNKAKNLLNNIQTRNIYKYIGEIKYTNDINKEFIEDYLFDNDIIKTDYIIQDMKLTFINDDLINNIYLYNKNNIDKSYKLTKEHITKIIPTQYKERTLRLFSKNFNSENHIKKIFSKL